VVGQQDAAGADPVGQGDCVVRRRVAEQGLGGDLIRQQERVVDQQVDDVIRSHVQQAIRPEAVALSVFGAIAALAMVVLVGQGLAQMTSRSAPDTAVLRVLGATRGQAALAAALPGLIAVLAPFRPRQGACEA